MKIFHKDMKLNWWQVSLFKLSMVSLGILLGVWYWDFFAGYTTLLVILFLVPGLYITYVWLQQ